MSSKQLIIVGCILVCLALVLMYQQDQSMNSDTPSTFLSAVLMGCLLLGMFFGFAGSIKLCGQSNRLQLTLASVCCLAIVAATASLASLSKSGLNPHGFGIILGRPVLETLILSVVFAIAAIGKWKSRS